MSVECVKEKEPEGFAAFLSWIWNPNTREFLGRTGSSWFKVGVFYLIFYAFLALFWAMMLKIFMTTISYDRPKWTLDESLIGLSPGLGFRPSPKFEKIESTLIHFRPSRNESYYPWVKDLKDFLKPYQENYNKKTECRQFPTRNERCPFLVNLADHSCGANFGYDTGSPCVLIKLNRIFNWKPKPYRSIDEIRNGIKNNSQGRPISIEPKVSSRDLSSGEGQISIQCEGENASDREKLSAIEYWPKQGFPAEYYPYTNQEGYLSPFVLVKFNNPSRGMVINIDCVAMDKAINIHKTDRQGSVNFQLLIDN